MDVIKIKKSKQDRIRRTNIVDNRELDDRKRICMNALLNHPWIAKETDLQLYYWIKEQYLEIRNWFMTYTGYSLILNRKLAKLEKIPVVAKSWMGFSDFRDCMDYTLFTYGLWFLENKTEGEQFLLTDMVREIKEYMNEQRMDVDWKNYFHRLSMARALKKMKNLNIIQSIDGQEVEWAASVENHDVLYECNSYARYVLRNFQKDLTNYKTMEELAELPEENLEKDEKNLLKRYQLYRRYLLEPIILNKEWKDSQFYFHGQKNNLITQIGKMFGWQGNKYREGILFFNPELMTDGEVFPTLSSISDIAMLFCDEIRRLFEKGEFHSEGFVNDSVRITRSKIEHILLELQKRYATFWTNEYRKIKSSDLAESVCDHLIEWGFGEWQDEMFFLLNSVGGRWKVQYGPTELDD